jgi:membrane-anchored protein YejM (alkaline phosphatase superfamily)
MLLSESPRRQTVSKLVSWGHWFAFFNIIIALLISSIYVFATPLPDSMLGQLYLGLNWLGHISFITFLAFILFIIPLCYNFSNVRVVKGISSVLAALGLALLAFDALIYTRTGVHVSLTAREIIVDEAVQQTSQLSWQEGVFFTVLFIIWLSFQLLIANALWQRIEKFSRKRIGQSVIGLFTACFIGSHALHVWADAELYQPIIKQDDMFPLSYPATAKTTLSRYGLLDLNSYETKKTVQFSYEVNQLNYPKEPVYCPLTNTKPWLVIFGTERLNTDFLPLHSSIPNFQTTESLEEQITTLLYGLPSLYHQYLNNTDPVVLELLRGFSIPTTMVLPSNVITIPENIDVVSQQVLLNTLQNSAQGFFFTVADADDYESIVTSIDLNNFSWLIVNNSNEGASSIHSNLKLISTIALNEDVIPTVLDAMGCTVDPTVYSNGQSLVKPTRKWHVTTQNDAVVLLTEHTVTQVLNNGMVEITNRQNKQPLNEPLDNVLFIRAMKHLNQFSTVK